MTCNVTSGDARCRMNFVLHMSQFDPLNSANLRQAADRPLSLGGAGGCTP